MRRSPRIGNTIRLALALSATLAVAIPAVAASAEEAKESMAAFEQQLAGGQVASAKINRRLGRVHVVLEDGSRAFAHYGRHEEPRVAAQLKAKHVPVTVLSRSQAASEAKKIPHHHKIRYIVGGVVVALIVLVAAVVLIRRHRLAD